MTDQAICELCGNPMPPGEEMFKFHGHSGPCPVPTPEALSRKEESDRLAANTRVNAEAQEPCYNPAVKVHFRAGFLACREILARFAEQVGNKELAASIRVNWCLRLGPDPGAPRQLRFDEVAEEIGERIAAKPIEPSVEALAHAWAFIETM